MFHTHFKTAVLGAVALSTALLAACGPNPNTAVPGNPSNAKLTAIAVSEISPDNAATSSISLGWDSLGPSVTSLKIFRRKSTDAVADASEISKVDPPTKTTLTDRDASLQAGVQYIYNLRGDNANNIPIATAESKPVSIINASDVKPFNLLTPATNDAILKDPLGQGHTFTWEDAGTGLYHVQVSDQSGTVLWGAITKNHSITYGTRTGTEKQGTITTQPDPKLTVPQALTTKLIISSVNPDTNRNEVLFKGLGSTGQYVIQVSAIQTQPTAGDLAGAQSIAIRKAKEIRFFAQ